MSTSEHGIMNETPLPDPTRSAAKAITATANALSDVASAQVPGLGKFAPIANISAVALIGLMLWFSQRDAASTAKDDRGQHAADLKTVVDMVREHQTANRDDNIRSAATITESVKDLTREIRGQRDDYRRRLGLKETPADKPD